MVYLELISKRYSNGTLKDCDIYLQFKFHQEKTKNKKLSLSNIYHLGQYEPHCHIYESWIKFDCNKVINKEYVSMEYDK